MIDFGGLSLSLLVAAAFAVPAGAQQPPAAPTTASNRRQNPSRRRKPAATGGGRRPAVLQPKLLGQFGDWGAYAAAPGGKKVCFALAKPASGETTPPGRPRNPAYMFISTRPADKVTNEVSIIIGYPFKPGSEATAEVGTTTFALYTQQDGAWIKNAAEEAHMVDAMRQGAERGGEGHVHKGHAIDRYVFPQGPRPGPRSHRPGLQIAGFALGASSLRPTDIAGLLLMRSKFRSGPVGSPASAPIYAQSAVADWASFLDAPLLDEP